MFADDTTVAIRGNNIEGLSYKCESCIRPLKQKVHKKWLNINFDKPEFKLFTNRLHQIDDSFISIVCPKHLNLQSFCINFEIFYRN